MVEHSATVPYSAVIAEASIYVKTSFAERLKILRESWAKAGSCTTRTVRLADSLPTRLQASISQHVAILLILIGSDGDLGPLRLASLG